MKHTARDFIILLAFCFALPALATVRNVQSYGATGNGSTDDTSAINNAIAAMVAGDELYFPCPSSYYKISSALTTIAKNNITIDGQTGCSGGKVKIVDTCAGCTIMQVGAGAISPSTPLTADSTELGTTFTANLSAIGGLVAGDYVLLQMTGRDFSSDTTGDDHGCDVSGCRGEVLKILSVNGNTATVTTALHFPYDVFHTSSCDANCAGGPGVGVSKFTSYIDNAYIHDLYFDGNGTATSGFYIVTATNSTVSNLTFNNFTDAAAFSDFAFNLAWNNITNTHSGGTNLVFNLLLHGQGKSSVNGYSSTLINQPCPPGGCGAGGFSSRVSADGTFTNMLIDKSTNTGGRPFKLSGSSYNTFNSLTIRNLASGGNNGLDMNYYSSHNTFNNCVVTNNSGNQIAGFGNYNQYNTFVNCTVSSGNGVGSALGQSQSALGFYNDNYWEISGGTYTGYPGYNVLQINGNNTYIHNATIAGPSTSSRSNVGIELGASANDCVNSNTFTSGTLASGYDIDASSSTGSLFNGNTTPDGVTPSPLPSGACLPGGGAGPAPPSGLTATVQ